MQPAAAGCIIFCAPIPGTLVLISPTSKGWQAESTHLVLIQQQQKTGAQTQDPKFIKPATLTAKATRGFKLNYLLEYSRTQITFFALPRSSSLAILGRVK